MTHLNPRSIRLAILFYAGLALGGVLGGCTASFQAHYPGKWNAVDTYEPGRTVYRAHEVARHNPVYAPENRDYAHKEDSRAHAVDPWYKGMDLGLR